MLRKTAGQSGPAAKAHYDSSGLDKKGGKQAKAKRQSKQRAQSTILFLLIIGVTCCGALYYFQDSTDFDPFGPGGLRSRALKKTQKFYGHPSLLPPDSIYHLSVEDCEGEKISLEQYTGSVSLVVNVASH